MDPKIVKSIQADVFAKYGCEGSGYVPENALIEITYRIITYGLEINSPELAEEFRKKAIDMIEDGLKTLNIQKCPIEAYQRKTPTVN